MPGDNDKTDAPRPIADRFIWPPKRDRIDAEAPVNLERMPEQPDALQSQNGPAELDHETADESEHDAQHSWWGEIEQFWLDTTAAPLTQRRVQTGWNPDAATAYCPRCARTLMPGEVVATSCRECAGTRPPWDRIVRLGEYAPPLRGWIQELKFQRFRRIGKDLGVVLGQQLRQEIEQSSLKLDLRHRGTLAIVPVPTTLRRRLVRGIDHTGTIARSVAQELGVPILRPIRREHRPSQLEVLPSERQENVAKAFGPRLSLKGRGLGCRLVVVVDDVTTTGATLRAACRAVRACCSETERITLWAAVVART